MAPSLSPLSLTCVCKIFSNSLFYSGDTHTDFCIARARDNGDRAKLSTAHGSNTHAAIAATVAEVVAHRARTAAAACHLPRQVRRAAGQTGRCSDTTTPAVWTADTDVNAYRRSRDYFLCPAIQGEVRGNSGVGFLGGAEM